MGRIHAARRLRTARTCSAAHLGSSWNFCEILRLPYNRFPLAWEFDMVSRNRLGDSGACDLDRARKVDRAGTVQARTLVARLNSLKVSNFPTKVASSEFLNFDDRERPLWRRPITTEAIGSAATHPSLRGALATKQSRGHNMRGASNTDGRTAAPGLLRFARNDGQGIQGIGSLVSACRLW
jgi:hypothetical protein